MSTSTARARLDPVREAAYRRLAGAYPADPVGYARDVLAAKLTPQQEAMPSALSAPPYRALFPSANKVGKTFAVAWLVNHFHDSHDPGIALVTSATYQSVKTQVFKEVRRVRPFGVGLKPRAPEIFHTDNHQVIGFSTSNPDAFQGQHEGRWLLVFDEATSVPQVLWDRAETMFSSVPGHNWACFYNPNDPTTAPYAAEQSGGWAVRRLSALDHPNVAAELRGEPPPYPRAVRLARIRLRIEKECEACGHTPAEGSFEFPPGSGRYFKPVKPEFNPQVMGRWPDHATNAVWGREDWRRCLAETSIDPFWPVQVGCDVARFGSDLTVFAVRQGTALIHLEARQGWTTRQIADRLRELCVTYCPDGMRPRQIPCAIDDTGGYGAGVVDYPDGYHFVGVNASETARDPTRYPNRRSELWFTAKLAAEEGGFYAGNCRSGRDLVPLLGQEFTSTRYSLDKKGRRVVEGKEAIRERLKRSPDLADGVNLAWFPLSA